MILTPWERLPEPIKKEAVRPYWEKLNRKRFSLFLKRVFDLLMSAVLLILLSPLMAVLAIVIKADSKGPVFYRQERVTQNGKRFRIHKFRTMADFQNPAGPLVTGENDPRITKVGKVLRKFRLDEISQLIDVLEGKMSFVGTRPEVEKYIDRYTDEMMATLLLPAGITSSASIRFRNEGKMFNAGDDPEDVYLKKILPEKMKYNLEDLNHFSLLRELGICVKTVIAVFSNKD